MPRRRACTTAAACGLVALVATAPRCSHALVAPRHGLGSARAVSGRRHLFDDEDDEGAVSDADFEGDSLKARARKAWAATPPVTQVYVGSSLALTLGSFFLAGNQWPSWLNLDWKKVMTGQLWFLSGVHSFKGTRGR